MSKAKKSLFSAILLCILSVTPLEAISRGEALNDILTALDLPIWQGEAFSDVPANHPYARSIESAFAMGILFPSDRFYPDIPASRAEALAFAFRAMGWEHTGKLMASYGNPPSDIPPYLSFYIPLGRSTNPEVPPQIMDSPKEEFTKEDSRELGLWLKKCLEQGIKWDYSAGKDGLTLMVHREGVGRPPQGWVISLSENETSQESLSMANKLKKLGFKVNIETDQSNQTTSVTIGPYGNYFQAWLVSKALPSPCGGSPVLPQGGGKQTIFWAAIKAPAERAFIKTAPLLGAKTLPLSQIAEHSNATAAINAGFFGGGKPIGTLVIDGLPVSAPYKDRSAIGWNQRGEVSFGSGYYRPSAITELGEVPLSGVNQPIKEDHLGLYTPHFGQIATQIRGAGTEISVENGKILSRKDSMRSNHMMGEDKMIVWARTAGLGFLSEALELSVDLQWRDETMKKASQVIQAGPMLVGVCNGIGIAQEGFSSSIIDKRHPRTIVGWDGSALWWIAVDGRSSWHSDGLTIQEAIDLAMGLGMTNALNLDGGGSTQLWWNGKTVNRTSDGRERPLPYAVVFR